MRLLPRFGFCASAAVVGFWALTLGDQAYALPSNCSLASSTVSCTFAETGAAQDFVVPSGVTAITVDAYGAQGGSSGGTGCNPGVRDGVVGERSGVLSVSVEPGRDPDRRGDGSDLQGAGNR